MTDKFYDKLYAYAGMKNIKTTEEAAACLEELILAYNPGSLGDALRILYLILNDLEYRILPFKGGKAPDGRIIDWGKWEKVKSIAFKLLQMRYDDSLPQIRTLEGWAVKLARVSFSYHDSIVLASTKLLKLADIDSASNFAGKLELLFDTVAALDLLVLHEANSFQLKHGGIPVNIGRLGERSYWRLVKMKAFNMLDEEYYYDENDPYNVLSEPLKNLRCKPFNK